MKVSHAELKPSNVLFFLVEQMVDERLRVKLCDFSNSFACIGPVASETCEIVSLPYRPLELLLGSRRIGVSIDAWSFGVIVSELALGSVCLQSTS